MGRSDGARGTGNRGFSLVELLVVIAIISILAAVGTAVYITIVHNAEENTCKIQRKTAIELYEIYIVENGKFDVDNVVGMEFLSDPILLEKEYTCPCGGEYTWHVNDGSVCITCSHHEDSDVVQANTSLGND